MFTNTFQLMPLRIAELQNCAHLIFNKQSTSRSCCF